MNDNIPANPPASGDDVTSMRTANRSRHEPQEKSFVGSAFFGILWVGVLGAGAVSVLPIAQSAIREFEHYSLVQADTGVIRGRLDQTQPAADVGELEALSELALLLETDQRPKALELARKAVAEDPHRPFVWARIAWLETETNRSVNTAAIDALGKSMAYCPLCDEELIRWRFNFVLGHWSAIPDELRRKAFEQADILRWRGENAEFLAEMGAKARQAGIPFDAYRAAVNTPVRSREIGPAPATASR